MKLFEQMHSGDNEETKQSPTKANKPDESILLEKQKQEEAQKREEAQRKQAEAKQQKIEEQIRKDKEEREKQEEELAEKRYSFYP